MCASIADVRGVEYQNATSRPYAYDQSSPQEHEMRQLKETRRFRWRALRVTGYHIFPVNPQSHQGHMEWIEFDITVERARREGHGICSL